jgi:hypothetical protein
MDYMPEIERAKATVEQAMRDAKELADKLPDGHAKLSALTLVSQLVSASAILGIRQPAVPCRLDFVANDAPQPSNGYMRSAVNAVVKERLRQIEQEGWTPDHDQEHAGGELAKAAACYAAGQPVVGLWPNGWDFKETDKYRMLAKSGALVMAELERIDRLLDWAERHGPSGSAQVRDDE